MPAFIMIAMTVLSIGMQISAAQSARRRQARMKREAAERADQAKGFTFVTEGQSSPLPIFYGRNKVGGIRVYHALSSNYVFAEANGNSKVFCPYVNPDSRRVFSCDAEGAITLVSGIPEPITDYYVFPRGGERWDAVQTIPSTFFSGVTDTLPKGDYAYYPKFTGAVPNELPPFPIFPVNDANGAMLSNQTGTKREYFTVEQALCFGTINDVVHVLVEGKDWDHPSFSETMRIVVHKSGGIADSLAIANHNRTGAKFTHAAHLTGVFKLNRDDPQFNGGAPEVQAIIEGTLVRTIIGSPGAYELSASRSYTNNPAYCLLDYLTNGVYGLGLSVDKIDLGSFKKAADICDIPVSRFDSTLVNLKLEGEYWRRKGITRNYKLFECNLGLSSAKPVRDNVETLLETMGLAELVWSAGKYSLNLMHPIPVAEGATFNANDVGYFQTTNEYKRWDGSAWIDDVVAHITDDDIVRAKDITFAWPGAQSRQNLVTVKFNNEAKGFSEDTATWPKRYSALHNQLLEEDGHVPLESESFETGVTDYYHALAKAEQRVRISRRSTNYQLTLLRKHSNLESGDLIRVASNVLGIPGEVLRIESTKIEENGDVSVEAFTYNCLDLAWNAKDTEIVDVPNIYSTDIGQATNVRFVPVSNTIAGSSGTLYWDAADDSSVVDYTVMYTTEAAEYVNLATSWLELKRVKGTYADLPALVGGTFTLTVVANTATRRAPFKSYYTGSGWPLLQVGVMPTRIDGKYSAALTIYKRDVSVPSTPTGGSYNFKSNTFLTLPSGWYSSKPSGASQLYTSTTIAESDASLQDTALTWSAPRVAVSDPNSVFLDKPLVGVIENDGSYDFTQANGNVVVIRNAVDVTSACEFQVVQQSNCVVTVNSVGHYAVTAVSAYSAFALIAIKVGGEEMLRTLTVSVLKAVDVRDLTPPPDVAAVSVTVGMTSVFLALPSAPSYPQGGGHYSTTMYYTTGSLLFADAKSMDEFTGTDHVVASAPNRILKLWFKFKTKDGIESVVAFGPLDASTGYIEGTDLNPLIIESLEIANGSITTIKLADNAVEMAKIANGAVVTDKIAASAITAGKVAANAITADNIAANAITADKVAANAITTSKLAAGSIAVGTAAIADGAIVRAMIGSGAIDSAKIADAAIGSAKISNTLQSDNFNAGYTGWRLRKDLGSIEVSQLTVYDGAGNVVLSSGGVPYSFVSGKPTSLSSINATEGTKLSGIATGATVGANTSNLNIGLGTNLLPNTEFLNNNIAPVVIGWNVSGVYPITLRGDDAWRPKGGQALEMLQPTRSGNQYNVGADCYLNGGYATPLNGIPVIAGKRYEMSAKLASHRCDSMLAIAFFDVNNAAIREDNTGWVTRASGGNLYTSWTHACLFGTAPANAAYACVYWRKSDSDVGTNDSYAWLSQPHFGEALASQTVPSTYSPGNSYAALTANWGNVSGSGKPADGATVGATFGVNVGGQITAGNASTYIANAAIGTAHIIDAAITSAKIGDAQIIAAKIGNAEIGTLKIAGSAITVPSIATGTTSASGSFLLDYPGWVGAVFGAQIPPGQTVDANRTVTLKINGVAKRTAVAAYSSSGSSSAMGGHGEYLAAGTHSYSVSSPVSTSIFVNMTASKR